jgi:hypothetical protein
MNRFRFVFLAVCMLFFASACMGPPKTRDQQLTLYEKRKAACSKEYTGFTKEQIIAAAEKVVLLLDPNDIKFKHYPNGFIGTRSWLMFCLMTASQGEDYWVFKAEEVDKNRVRATVRLLGFSETNWVENPGSVKPGNDLDVSVEQSQLSEAAGVVFFSRVDYFLGLSDMWLNCHSGRSYAQSQRLEMEDMLLFMCGDIQGAVGVEEKPPDYLKQNAPK